MSDILKRVDEMSMAEKRSLLAEILRKKADSVRRVPFSFAQERLWFLDQFQPGRATYNVAVALRITAPLNVNALESSVNEIVRRHEVLRTTFALVEERPVQVIASEAKVSLPVVDLIRRKASAPQGVALRLAPEQAHPPFAPPPPPLSRPTLLPPS